LRRPVVSGGAEPGADAAGKDPNLALLIKRWAGLPEALKRAVLALVTSAE